MNGAMEQIRKAYNVPAKRGMIIIYRGQSATIKSAKCGRLRIKIEGRKHIALIHPTWEVIYPN